MFYILDLIGVAVFAISGALAAGVIGLDPIGVAVFAALTAVGGGTMRDLLLDRHPIFWIADPRYLYVIGASALFTVFYVRFLPVPAYALQIADALGLALFAILGAQLAEAARLRAVPIVLLGTMTGVAGGVLRDVLSGQIPMLLRKDIYASAAIAGICIYLMLQFVGVKRVWALWTGIAVIAGVRIASIIWGWQLPTFDFKG